MPTVREIRLKSRPSGLPTHDNFELASVELGAPGPGEVQVQNLWMTVDPYMRGRMNDVKSYVPQFQLGEPMDGGAIGEVVESQAEGLAPGAVGKSMPSVAVLKVRPLWTTEPARFGNSVDRA